MLTVKNVSKNFGQIKALDRVSFEIESGEMVFLTGPSGSGKTTLFRLIMGEIHPDSGEIIFDGRHVQTLDGKELSLYRRQIGMVFQDFKVLPERTIWENIEVALAVIGVPDKDRPDRMRQVLELVGLKNRADLFPSQISGGELQRVSLARALVVNPKLILADEPTGNLDWDKADEIMEIFNKINKEGKTVVIAMHNRHIIRKAHKKIIVLNNGKIVI